MLDLKAIKETDKFVVKWGGASYTGTDENNKMSPGWMLETQEDSLLVRLDEQTSIMKDSTFIKMDARQHAIDYLFVRPTLQPMSNNGGLFNAELSTLTETIPKFARRELDAKPYVAYTYTPKQFIWENVEKEAFLGQYESLLAEACGVSAEAVAMYADKDNGDTIDGLFKQLKMISQETDEEVIRENGKGFYGVVDRTPTTGTLVGQIMDFITAFIDQNGNIDNAVIYTSVMTRGTILKETAQRQTDLGDTVYINGNDITIFGVPVKTASFLSRPMNGQGEKILICDPKSIVFGFVSQIESESTYEHSRKAYLSSIDLEMDIGMIYPVDVLYADIQDGAITGKVTNNTEKAVTLNPVDNVTSASITVEAGKTVEVPVGTYMNDNDKVKVGKGQEVKITP